MGGHVEWKKGCNCRLSDGSLIGSKSASPKAAEANLYFSVPAFVVLFRESFEVVVILVIVIQFLSKSKEKGVIDQALFNKLRREVYLGAGLGFLICLIFGALCILAASALYSLFEGDARYVADGVMMTIACIFLTGLAFNFYKLIYTQVCHERKIAARISEVLAEAKKEEHGGQSSMGKKHAFFFF